MQNIKNGDIIKTIIEQLANFPYDMKTVMFIINTEINGETKSGTNLIGNLNLTKHEKMIMLASFIKQLGITKQDLLNPLGE